MKGRKPKPASVLRLQGSYKRNPEREKDNPTAPGIPKKPRHLVGYAAAEWDKMIELMIEMKIIEKCDRAALEIYCESYADWRHASEQIKRLGNNLILITEGKKAQRNPLVSVKNACADRCYKFLVEFGMTPSSRARLEARAEETGGDWFEEALRNRKARGN